MVNESTLASQPIFAPNANIINLRGLGPGRSLVLINGRRVAEYPLPYGGQSNFINLGAIPSSAVERIEVLSGGASAIYGSDAVAGVMNIVTKKNYEGLEAKLYGSSTTRGGGDTGNLQIVGGKSGDRWTLTYAMEYMNREAIFTCQRDFMDSMLDSPIASGRTPGQPVPVRSRRPRLRQRDRRRLRPLLRPQACLHHSFGSCCAQ